MVFFLEFARPFQLKPFWFNSRTMRRYGWGWWSFGWFKQDLATHCEDLASGKVGWTTKTGDVPFIW